MSTQIQYGSVEKTEVIDKNGSTVSRTIGYKDYQAGQFVTATYKIRHKVRDVTIEQLGEMVHNLLTDKSKIKPWVELQQSDGSDAPQFFIVECYKVIEPNS